MIISDDNDGSKCQDGYIAGLTVLCLRSTSYTFGTFIVFVKNVEIVSSILIELTISALHTRFRCDH